MTMPWKFRLNVWDLIYISVFCGSIWYLNSPGPNPNREYFEGKDQVQWVSELQSSDPNKRNLAIYALCEMVKRPDPKHRMSLVRALGFFGGEAKQVEETIRGLLPTDDEELEEACEVALKKIEARRHGS